MTDALSYAPQPNDGSLLVIPNRGSPSSSVAGESGGSAAARCEVEEVKERDKQSRDQLSFLALLIDIFRKSWVSCKSDRRELCAMEIGWPTNVRHVAHVTFDRFHGFLGLPVEFEPEVPRRAPSASAHVFGVSTESMQLSFDSRGNSVPTILLLMQRHLYAQGGLQAEGIFRINAENSQEEYVRGQLNRGVVPEGIHIHCLAGLIKAWFRELPIGILDSLSPEQVMQCQTEEQCSELVRGLPPTESALLDWAINLMADVAQQEHLNKMNARNIAMVFAPNMTKMADPLTALMYAVQVMNFLKTLVLKALRERKNSVLEPVPASCLEPSDENGHQSPSHPCLEDTVQDDEDIEQAFMAEEPSTKSLQDYNQGSETSLLNCFEKLVPDENGWSFDTRLQVDTFINETEAGEVNGPNGIVHRNNTAKNKIGQSSSSSLKRGPRKLNGQEPVVLIEGTAEKTKGISGLSCLDSRTERIEAWR